MQTVPKPFPLTPFGGPKKTLSCTYLQASKSLIRTYFGLFGAPEKASQHQQSECLGLEGLGGLGLLPEGWVSQHKGLIGLKIVARVNRGPSES